ncbi:hypothetical protein [Nocardioides euryhalodurans]|uniref:Uncharacterized protein n=1 Tax=Nocardioides euryhalodurans TaxID=2518370 RepID=A0A4P7GKN0_9ACTN|nr:hypothetical protein [Nocardioides euryhalodurans]QBR92327.1 hypothetical protein EXE57_08540 [Nocardioides euryhalodurans]
MADHGTTAGDPELVERAARLKERVYITFTALAVVLALGSHAESAGRAALTLLIAVTGTALAVLVADVVAHVVVHARLPTGRELGSMVRVSSSALASLLLPFVFLGLGVAGIWESDTALRAATIALVVALVAIGYLAVRRLQLPLLQRLVVLLAEVVLGLAVIALELLAHG